MRFSWIDKDSNQPLFSKEKERDKKKKGVWPSWSAYPTTVCRIVSERGIYERGSVLHYTRVINDLRGS